MGTIMTQLGTGQGYLKAGFLGFPKSGKTYTAVLLALATREHFKLKGPVAMYDTEGGSEYIARIVKQCTGQQLLGLRSRSFEDMLAMGKEAEQEGVSILLVDSVTHPWRELCDAYLQRVNNARMAKNLRPRNRLEFQDWGAIKGTWAQWTDFYLNAKLHIIICGRAGFEYDWSTDEETNRKELTKTGIKMKTETEFGFEPSLLVKMDRDQQADNTIVHTALILGDRFGLIDGKEYAFKGMGDWRKELKPVWDFFGPHIEALKPGAHAPIDTEVRTNIDVDDEGNYEAYRHRQEKTILAEEIKGQLLKGWPGRTDRETKAKADLLEEVFCTRSWTKVENLPNQILRAGLDVVRQKVNKELGIEEDVPSVDDGKEKITHVCEDCGQGLTGMPEDETCFACGGIVKKIEDIPDSEPEKPATKQKKKKKATGRSKKSKKEPYVCKQCGAKYDEMPVSGICEADGCFGALVKGAA